jgi:hypothetical protein
MLSAIRRILEIEVGKPYSRDEIGRLFDPPMTLDNMHTLGLPR